LKNFLTLTSILMIFLAGLAMAVISAYFGINGLLDLIPVPEFFLGILALGIALEIGKNVCAVVLFHLNSDEEFPVLLKSWLWIALITSMVLSFLFTYTHLYEPFSTTANVVEVKSEKIVIIKNRLLELKSEREGMDKQVEELPSNYATSRQKLIDAFAPRIKAIKAEETSLREKLTDLQGLNDVEPESNLLDFANNIGAMVGMDGRDFYALVTVFIVAIIDPFALGFAITGTYLLTSHVNSRNREKLVFENLKEVNLETRETVKPIIKETPVASPKKEETMVSSEVKEDLSSPEKHKVKKVLKKKVTQPKTEVTRFKGEDRYEGPSRKVIVAKSSNVEEVHN